MALKKPLDPLTFDKPYHCQILNKNHVSCSTASPDCIVYSYNLPKPFNTCGKTFLKNNYPSNGCYAMNESCDELIHITCGTGCILIVETVANANAMVDIVKKHFLDIGDCFLIPKNTLFRYELGPVENLSLFIVSQPKSTQHVFIKHPYL